MKSVKIFKILFVIIFFQSILNSEIVEKIEVSSKTLFEKMMSKNIIIIDKDLIKDYEIQTLSDVFRLIPGVNISRRGVGDASYDVSVRGSNFEQVQILINGLPFNNPQTGHFNTDLPIEIENIERIEISRGSGSVSHGPGGPAGNINIILKEQKGVRFDLRIGERSLTGIGIGVGEKSGNTNFNISADTISSKGYYEGQEFNKSNINSTLSHYSGRSSVFINAGYLSKQFGAKDFYAPYPSKEKIESGNFSFKYKRSGIIEHEFNFAAVLHNDKFILDRYDINFFRSDSRTNRKYFKYQNYFSSGSLLFSMGADLDQVKIKSSVIGEHSRNVYGLFFKTGLIKNNWGIDLGIRWDIENDQHPVYSLFTGIYRIFLNNITFRSNFAIKSRYPTFTELYYISPANNGNRNLKPESSENFNLSLDLPLKPFNFGISVFVRNQYNMIDWIKLENGNPWRAVNQETNKVYGYEMSVIISEKSYSITGSFERIIIPGYKNDFISKYGYRFPDKKIALNLRKRIFGKVDLVMKNTYKRILETRETAHLTDLILRWNHKAFKISIIAENIFNSAIEEIPGVRIPGTWVMLNIKYYK